MWFPDALDREGAAPSEQGDDRSERDRRDGERPGRSDPLVVLLDLLSRERSGQRHGPVEVVGVRGAQAGDLQCLARPPDLGSDTIGQRPPIREYMTSGALGTTRAPEEL